MSRFLFIPDSGNGCPCSLCTCTQGTQTTAMIPGTQGGMVLCPYCLAQVKEHGLRWLRQEMLDRAESLIRQWSWMHDAAESIDTDADVLIVELEASPA